MLVLYNLTLYLFKNNYNYFIKQNSNLNINGSNSNINNINGPLYRPISATELRNNKPVFGRKQFSNQSNITANLQAKNLFGINYLIFFSFKKIIK